jgi:RNA-directed DNA polymerase
VSLSTPEKIRRLQEALYAKAKQEPEYRFYLLWDKMIREDVLVHAYALSRSKKGAPGVDGQRFQDIEDYGVERWLGELKEEVRTGRYRPQPVRRKMIPKPGGTGERPLGIPTIRDRVLQRAALLVLEPIFEADFDDSAYGYRPERSAAQAVKKVHETLLAGNTQVVDADLTAYFDTIPHEGLMKCLARRISDGRMLHLLKMWLKAPVEERDGEGRRRYTGGKKSTMGTPQGGVISPLLANIYFHRYIKAFRKYGLSERFGAVLVNYADDFVLLCRRQAPEVLSITREWMKRIGLALNEKKTRIVNAQQKAFDFLGYSFGPRHTKKDGRWYLGAYPSKKAIRRLKEKVRKVLKPGNQAPWPFVAKLLNPVLRGWGSYFSYGSVWGARASVDRHVAERVRHFLRRRSGSKKGRGLKQCLPSRVFGELGVLKTQDLPRVRNAHAFA